VSDVIAVLGLGEAGSLLASDLVAAGASEAVNALEASAGALRPSAVWADLNTAAPSRHGTDNSNKRAAQGGGEQGTGRGA
jgi:hypothetical protein